MQHEMSELVAKLLPAGQMTEGDILHLRRLIWEGDELGEDADIGEDEANALFAINDACVASSGWVDFFVEAIEHYLVNQRAPRGFVSDENAMWLMNKINKDGRVDTMAELELIVSVLEASENMAHSLKDFALHQVENIVLTGTGPTRHGGDIRPNQVDEAEASLLRRLIFASGGESATVVSTEEADLLFRIKDATLDAQNAPSWRTLFVQGVGNHLMAHSDYRPLSRDEAKRLNTFMNDNTPNVGNFLSRMVPGHMFGSGSLTESFKTLFDQDEDHYAHGLEMEQCNLITAEEAAWLKMHIAADAEIDGYEKALLTFIIEESGNAPPGLDGLRLRA